MTTCTCTAHVSYLCVRVSGYYICYARIIKGYTYLNVMIYIYNIVIYIYIIIVGHRKSGSALHGVRRWMPSSACTA